MPLVPFHELMTAASRGRYAVGYFECWSLDSLMAVADAAERTRSPVILGYSGIYLPHPQRKVRDPISPYAAMGLEVCHTLTVPAVLLFNESPHLDWVRSALEVGFNLVMFSDERLAADDQLYVVQELVECAHEFEAAVEAELTPLAGLTGDVPTNGAAAARLTSFDAAAQFVLETGVDALAVNVGQVHYHGRRTVRLDMERLAELKRLPVPLVLHGATSVERDDIRAAVELGVRKINVGSRLKQVYFQALRQACAKVPESANPYITIGSNLDGDVLLAGRLALQLAVEDYMKLFGSTGKG